MSIEEKLEIAVQQALDALPSIEVLTDDIEAELEYAEENYEPIDVREVRKDSRRAIRNANKDLQRAVKIFERASKLFYKYVEDTEKSIAQLASRHEL